MKQTVMVIISIILVMSSVYRGECDTIKLVIDNKKVSLDTSPMIRKATVFVPLRGVFEVFKAQVTYDKPTQTVRAVKGKKTVSLVVDSMEAKVNGINKIMPIPAFMYNNRTMVPLRFVSEALGCDVRWEPGAYTVFINSKGVNDSGQKDPKDNDDIDDMDVDF